MAGWHLLVASNNSTNGTSSSVKLTGCRGGAHTARPGNLIEAITHLKSVVAFTRWTISVPGMSVGVLLVARLTPPTRAGGIISETNFKFFLQFCAYAALYCIFNLVVLAYYLANPPGTNGRSDVYKVNWIVVIAL